MLAYARRLRPYAGHRDLLGTREQLSDALVAEPDMCEIKTSNLGHSSRPEKHCLFKRAPEIVTTITGAPLTVLVGDEHSYQIFNADIPGVGQVYPSNPAGTADMGWMVRASDTLYIKDRDGRRGSLRSSGAWREPQLRDL